MKKLLIALGAFGLAACGQPANEAATTSAVAEHDLAVSNLPAFFDCLREKSQTVVAAHRGGNMPGFAENSIDTFAHTLSLAPALLEIDVAETEDGTLVLMHDDTVDRTTDGTGAVRDLSLTQFQELSLKDDDGNALDVHPPTLRQALDWAEGKTVLEIDVKRGVAYEDVVEEIRAADAEDRVIFITYSTDAAIRVHGIDPALMLSVNINSEADLDALIAGGVDAAHILAWTGTEEPNSALNVALAQKGVEVLFGTLGAPDQSWDGKFSREGDQYAAFAETGIQLIASDRFQAAVADLDAHDGVEGYGALQCAAH